MRRRDVWPGSPGRAALTGCAVAVLLALTWTWPALGRGQLLYRDFVQVPDPVLGPSVLGTDGRAPRAVPLDAVTALLAPVVPSGVQQQVMLLASLALAGCGLAVLLRRRGAAACVVAAAVAVWSPYAAQRLLVGQPPTLLGWAMVPWLVVAVRRDGSPRRRVLAVLVAALPAALTPFGGLLALGVVVVTALATRHRPGRRRREPVVLGALGVVWCLPWVVAGLRGATAAGETSGARAFAVRADGVQGVLDVLGGGGIWAPAAALASRAHAPALVASTLLVLAAATVLVLAPSAPSAPSDSMRVSPKDGGPHPHDLRVLGAALVLPTVVALALASGPGLALWAPAQHVPGLGILRDTHRLLGLTVLATAVLLGLGVQALRRRLGPVGALGATATVLAVAVLGAPDAPARIHQAYRPTSFPPGWSAAVAVVGDRTTLVLPWQPFRRQAWVGGQPFLDPLPLALRGRVVASRNLTVPRDGGTVVVGSDDTTALRAWARGDLAALRDAGVEAVVTWADTPGEALAPPPGARRVETSGPLRVWLVDEPPTVRH
ncbi:hypothetical protein ACF3NS_03670 [Arsenicicoccus cauae]|uniref:hypothetical protein n=1 Tax=Arsenicicoccus cauae TaxID=2663847 RepID=UPI002598BD09|nr:hypothetical protein [uncultured Arsenicicoccus sp.]